MHYGVYQFSTDYAMRADDLARAVEERGLESLFVPEHTHIPASRKSPWPGGPNLPREYWRTLDPFVTLAAAAAVTSRLKLGTGICLVIERDPITLAKEVARPHRGRYRGSPAARRARRSGPGHRDREPVRRPCGRGQAGRLAGSGGGASAVHSAVGGPRPGAAAAGSIRRARRQSRLRLGLPS